MYNMGQHLSYSEFQAWVWELKPVVPATPETEMERREIQGQYGQKSLQDPISMNGWHVGMPPPQKINK
jgi:hypothetical protein